MKLTVYYDGLCHLCHKEIVHYQKMDRDNKIDFIDITDASFNADKHGLDSKTVQKYFHVKDKNNNIVKGVKAFDLIWKELSIFSPLQLIYKTPVLKQSMDIGYFLFAQVRPYLPKKEKCDDGFCKYR